MHFLKINGTWINPRAIRTAETVTAEEDSHDPPGTISVTIESGRVLKFLGAAATSLRSQLDFFSGKHIEILSSESDAPPGPESMDSSSSRPGSFRVEGFTGSRDETPLANPG